MGGCCCGVWLAASLLGVIFAALTWDLGTGCLLTEMPSDHASLLHALAHVLRGPFSGALHVPLLQGAAYGAGVPCPGEETSRRGSAGWRIERHGRIQQHGRGPSHGGSEGCAQRSEEEVRLRRQGVEDGV